MKKLLLPLLFLPNICSSEWVSLTPSDLLEYQIITANAYSFAEEGLYIKHKEKFSFSSSLPCSKKQFVAITDEKLSSSTLSTLMFAIASGKTVRFYVDGCTKDYPHVVSTMLKN